MKITKEFVTYEQSIALKELGFDEACICYYDVEDSYKLKPTPMKEEINAFHFNSTSIMTAAPLKQQVFRWFIEKYNLEGISQRAIEKELYKFWIYELHKDCKIMITDKYQFDTYEEAEDACLNELIEIVKNK